LSLFWKPLVIFIFSSERINPSPLSSEHPQVQSSPIFIFFSQTKLARLNLPFFHSFFRANPRSSSSFLAFLRELKSSPLFRFWRELESSPFFSSFLRANPTPFLRFWPNHLFLSRFSNQAVVKTSISSCPHLLLHEFICFCSE